jgi:hypothetical protein
MRRKSNEAVTLWRLQLFYEPPTKSRLPVVVVGLFYAQHPVLRENVGGHRSQPRDSGWVGATGPNQQPDLQPPIRFDV